MKLNSISGVSCFVEDVQQSADFYEALGFRMGKQTPDHVICYVNWFWVDLMAGSKADRPELQKEASLPHKGAGTFLHIKVDNIDEYYKEALAQGLQPETEPTVQASGNREFVLRDPDGYKLVFFEKK